MLKSRELLCGLVCLLLAACGGGGGGGSGSSSGGGSNPPPPPAPPAAGAFTLSGTSASFRAPRQHDIPASESFIMTVTGSGVATVGAAMPAAQAVTWLDVAVTGTAPNYLVTLRPNTTNLPVATATTTVVVGTANAAGTVLATREIQVSYDIYQGITITSAPPDQNFVYGGADTGTVSFSLNAQGRSYTVTSDETWVTAPAGVQSGNGPISLGLNVGAFIPLDWYANVRVAATADAADYVITRVHAKVAVPTFGVSNTTLLLGGEDGLDATLAGSLDLSLNTGANAWPWTVAVQDFTVPAALSTPVTSGTMSGNAGATFTLTADRAQLRPGTYTGTLHFSTTVKSMTFTRDVPLTLNWESQRLVPQYDGLSFYSNPSRAAPARQIVIQDSRGRAGIPWSASSDSPWLTITPTSGVTGAVATVAVNPAGLAAEALHTGLITLSSTNPSIERTETIRVGLWKGAAAAATISKPLTFTSGSMVTSPVEPYVYSIARDYDPGPGAAADPQVGGLIRVYHVFTGNLVRSFASGTTKPGSMTISSDGTRLFVTDYAGPGTLELDAQSGALLATHPASNNEFAGRDERHGIEFVRMNGRPVVWPAFTPYLTPVLPIDVESGQGLQPYSPGPGAGSAYSPRYDIFQAASPDGRFMYTASASSSAIINPVQHYFSVLGGGPRIRSVAGDFFAQSGNVADLCVGRDNKVWRSGEFLPMLAYDSNLANVVASFTMPAQWRTGNLICGAHGRNYVTIMDANGNGSENNVAMFDDSGALLGTFRHGPAGELFKSFEFKLSGDGTRLIWPTYAIVNRQLVDTLVISTVP
jgi:sugar lactone lactonase YvrE